MRYVRVKIRRDTQTTFNRTVLPWEVPILEYVFEAGNVELFGNEDNDATYPSAAEEFGRLGKAYGEDSDTGIAFVATVYGNAPRGVKALQAAIDEVREAQADDARKSRVKPAARKQVARKATRVADPLMA